MLMVVIESYSAFGATVVEIIGFLYYTESTIVYYRCIQ